jgi:rhodanese-related sulfurtransferase
MRRELIALSATLCAAGCSLSLGFGSEPPEPELLSVAVGAEVELRLGDCASVESGPLFRCVGSSVGTLNETSVGQAFEILSREVVDGDVRVLLRAKQEGSTSLKYSYRDVDGRKRRGEVPLQAAHPESVDIAVYCDGSGRSQDADSVLIGAGTELDLFVRAYSANRNALETGQLALLDFGSFAQLERAGSHVRLRAPPAAGSYLWQSTLGEPIEVRVFEQLGVALDLYPARAADQPTQLWLSPNVETPGTTVCNAPASAVASLQVERGDCQLGVHGIRFVGGVPIALPTDNGATIEVLGTGECVVSAQAPGLEPTALTLSLPERADAVPEGQVIGQSPLPFALHAPLPGADCFTGSPDGKCEASASAWFDADCTTDTSLRIALSDAHGSFQEEPLGAGLVSAVSLDAVVAAQRFALSRAPIEVSYSISAPFTANVEVGDCVVTEPRLRGAQLTLAGAGTGQLAFRASNLAAPAQLAFDLREVASCAIEHTFENTFEPAVVSDSAMPVFAGSLLTLGARCRDAEGNTLRGDPALTLTSDQTESRARITTKGKLYVGSAPSSLQIASSVGSGRQLLEVVGPEAASTLSTQVSAGTVREGDALFVKVTAFDQAGRGIQGIGDVALSAELVAERGAWLIDLSATNNHTIAVRSLSGEPSTLIISMGKARTEVALPPLPAE